MGGQGGPVGRSVHVDDRRSGPLPGAAPVGGHAVRPESEMPALTEVDKRPAAGDPVHLGIGDGVGYRRQELPAPDVSRAGGSEVIAGRAMESERHVQAAVGFGPHHRSKVLVPPEAFGVDLDFEPVQEHPRLGESSGVKIVGPDPGQAPGPPPDDVDVAAALDRLGVHAVVVEHLQGAVLSEPDRAPEQDGAHGEHRDNQTAHGFS